MKPKTAKILYWVVLIFLVLFALMDGVSGILRVESGKESLRMLGYPIYLLTIVGVAKVLGAIALLQKKSPTLREWAYAGFAINFIGAAASWAFVGGSLFFIALPLIFLALMFIPYYLWKQYGVGN